MDGDFGQPSGPSSDERSIVDAGRASAVPMVFLGTYRSGERVSGGRYERMLRMLRMLLMLGSGLLVRSVRSWAAVDGGVSPKDGRGLGARPKTPLQPQPLATSAATVRQLSMEGRALLELLACDPLLCLPSLFVESLERRCWRWLRPDAALCGLPPRLCPPPGPPPDPPPRGAPPCPQEAGTRSQAYSVSVDRDRSPRE